MVDLMHCLTGLLFFNIPLLYYVNLNSSIICCLSPVDIYIYFFWYFYFIIILVILLAIVLPIKAPAASAVF